MKEEAVLKDRHGVTVQTGDRIRVVTLPDVQVEASEWQELQTFLGKIYTIESTENGSAEISQQFDHGDGEYWHVLFLWPDEFEKL